jgi:hypothetical protein
MAAKVDYSKADVMNKDGMELVALRGLAESLGYTVTWNEMERSVTLTHGMAEGGMADGSMTDKGMADKGMADKGMTDKSMTDKGMTDKGMADKGMADKGMADKGMTDKDMTDKNMGGMYAVKIAIGSKTATVAMKEQMLADAPVIIDNKTYVTKAFVDMYLASPGMTMK